ncbi:hypothetical protein AS73P1_00050 [Alistipes phage AS73P1]|nr:hypothetical protein AS73P1_00050 [Alistipes phage AS73P1]
MRVKAGTEGKVKDVAITDVTPENYIVPDNEKHLYHCVIEVRKFDAETGKRLSVPRIQKFGKKAFDNGVGSNLKKQGYTITILHDPADFVKAQAEATQKANEAKAAAAEEARKVAEAKAAEENQKAIDAAVEKALQAQAEATQKAIDKAVADALAKTKAAEKTEAKK